MLRHGRPSGDCLSQQLGKEPSDALVDLVDDGPDLLDGLAGGIGELVPGEEILAIVGTHRVVLAFNPDDDDPGLLRAAVQLLVVQAQRRLADDRAGDLGLADAKLEEARRRLVDMQNILKTALAVRNGAGKVVTGLEALHGSLALSIDQARAALRGTISAGSTAA